MKRMHALPIELPLVASGEYVDESGYFKLDKKLESDKNYLIILEFPLYGSIITTQLYFNDKIGQNSSSQNFMIENSNAPICCFIDIPYDEEKDTIYLKGVYWFKDTNNWIITDIVDSFIDEEPPLIYIYELPYKIDNKAIL